MSSDAAAPGRGLAWPTLPSETPDRPERPEQPGASASRDPRAVSTDRFFPYHFERRYCFAWAPLGARPGRDGVTLGADGTFRATFGGFEVRTPLENVQGAHRSGPYRWWKAVGVRLSLADDGLTFGTSTRGGVCVHFATPIPRVVGMRPQHSALTVTVEDLDGLVAALGEAPPR